MSAGARLGVYYDDIVIGAEYDTGEYLVTRERILQFAELTRDTHPLHTDEAYCATTEFGRLVAHGLMGLSIMGGLKAEMKIYADVASVSLGWEKVRFLKAILAGDTVRGCVTFIEKHLVSDQRRGIVRQQVVLFNQRAELVTEAEHVALVKRASIT